MRDVFFIFMLVLIMCLMLGACSHAEAKQLLTLKQTSGVAVDKQTETQFNQLARVLFGDAKMVTSIFIQRAEKPGSFNFVAEALEVISDLNNEPRVFTVYGEINNKGDVVRYPDMSINEE